MLATVVRWYVAREIIGTGYEWFATFTTYFPKGLNVKLAKNFGGVIRL